MFSFVFNELGEKTDLAVAVPYRQIGGVVPMPIVSPDPQESVRNGATEAAGGAHALPSQSRSYIRRWGSKTGLFGNPLIYSRLNFQRELRPIPCLGKVPQQPVPVNGAAQRRAPAQELLG